MLTICKSLFHTSYIRNSAIFASQNKRTHYKARVTSNKAKASTSDIDLNTQHRSLNNGKRNKIS